MTVENTIATLINRKALTNERIGIFCSTITDSRTMAEKIIDHAIPGTHVTYNSAKRELEWDNGHKALFFSAFEPDSFRGMQFNYGVAMDVHEWNDSNAFRDARMCVRIGPDPELLALY